MLGCARGIETTNLSCAGVKFEQWTMSQNDYGVCGVYEADDRRATTSRHDARARWQRRVATDNTDRAARTDQRHATPTAPRTTM
eukprot:3394207-Lingulodinium_polyedra.AAC.1